MNAQLARQLARARPAWQQHAACRGHTPLFWPRHNEQDAERQVREMHAARICARCPVRTPCELDAAIDYTCYRAGTSATERWHMPTHELTEAQTRLQSLLDRLADAS